MSQKKDECRRRKEPVIGNTGKPISLLCKNIVAAHKKGLNDRKLIAESTRRELMASTWEPSRFQDILHQRALDRLNEQAAAIFTDPNAGTTTPALDWQISSMSQNDDPDKELLIKFLEGAETMQLYQAYIIDLKDYAINQYGPVVAKNSSAARDKALTWLVSEAGSTIYADRDIEIFDGDIEHYHIVVQEVSNCIPNKIKEK